MVESLCPPRVPISKFGSPATAAPRQPDLCATLENAGATGPQDRHPTAQAYGQALAAASPLLSPAGFLLGLRAGSRQPPASGAPAVSPALPPLVQHRRSARAPISRPCPSTGATRPPWKAGPAHRGEPVFVSALLPEISHDSGRPRLRAGDVLFAGLDSIGVLGFERIYRVMRVSEPKQWDHGGMDDRERCDDHALWHI
jgi:hypothetical protein